jgi:TnpA family transposase
MATALWAESVRTVTKLRLVICFQDKPNHLLYQFVRPAWDGDWPFLTVRFGYIDSAGGLPVIVAISELLDDGIYSGERHPLNRVHWIVTYCSCAAVAVQVFVSFEKQTTLPQVAVDAFEGQMTEEAQRQALAQVVNAISQLDVTQVWGAGRTSSSDGQRFRFKQRVLQQTWSHRFNDYALEFYSFVADNYAPFYSTVIECTDRDAAYVLDGLLYNESDLMLEEHYTDTHGYTEINFAAFAMLGRRFSPRIRGVQQQRIYRIDTDRDYGAIAPLLKRRDRIINLDWICSQWDRMGQFYASLESGHATASTALKRLVGYSGKNHFYRANRELGRVFKTEHILRFMSDPLMRQQMRRGLLKSEEMHALARHVAYGKQGKITARDWQEQKNTASCLTLIMVCIIYWQAKEISRVIFEHDPENAGVDLSLLERISPIGWDNIVLYGEYVLDPSLVMV